jgi:hypothetical protein
LHKVSIYLLNQEFNIEFPSVSKRKCVNKPLKVGFSLHKQVNKNEALIFSLSIDDCSTLNKEENPSQWTNASWASAHSLVRPKKINPLSN